MVKDLSKQYNYTPVADTLNDSTDAANAVSLAWRGKSSSMRICISKTLKWFQPEPVAIKAIIDFEDTYLDHGAVLADVTGLRKTVGTIVSTRCG